MLRTILAITGKPGLFKVLNHSGRSLIVEEIATGKRLSVGARERIVSLGDVAMYTEAADKPLGEILDLVYAHNEGKPVDVNALRKDGKLRDEFAAVLPEFDRERVYDTDIKKLFSWYNLLLEAGFTKFAEEEEEEAEEAAEAAE